MIEKVTAHNMDLYVTELSLSYATKRTLHQNFVDEQMIRGFEYTKTEFVKEKFPKFPKRLREKIATVI
jgi:hypothetical protein